MGETGNMLRLFRGFGANGEVLEVFQFIITFVIFLIIVKIFIFSLAQRKTWFQSNSGFGTKVPSFRGLEAIPQITPVFPLSFIGNLPLVLPISKAMTNLLRISKEYGDIGKFTALNLTFVVLNSAPLAQTLLRSNEFGHGIKEPTTYNMMRPFIGNGLLVSTGKFWQGQRKILMKSQSFSSLKTYLEMLNRHCSSFVTELDRLFQDGACHQINGLINTIFLKIINEMITGFDMRSSTEFNEYHHNFQIWKECAMHRLVNPLLFFNITWKFHPMRRKHDKAVAEMFEFAKKRIHEHRERRKLKGNDSVNTKSVLDELIDAGVDDNQIVHEVNTMMFGGHETGASVIHCFCFMMAVHQNIQQKCQHEIDELFNRSENDCDEQFQLSYESVQSGLKYLERCLLESLRLFPPAFMILRKLNTPLDLEYSGEKVRLPAGTATAIFPWCIHRKEEYYPEPEKFNPDRFLLEKQAKRHAYSFLAFSAGPRSCLGMKFAIIEMKIVAACLLRNFKMETTDKMEDINFLPYTTLTPERDFYFKFRKRVV